MLGLSDKLTSIFQAVSLLGTTSMVGIVNNLSIKGDMPDETIIKLTCFCVAEACSEAERGLTEIDNHHFNTNHSVIGYFTAKSWSLSDYICEVIAEQKALKLLGLTPWELTDLQSSYEEMGISVRHLTSFASASN